MRIVIARSVADIDRLRPAWEHLARACRRTIFQSFAWNRLAAQVFADREAPHVVYAENQRGSALLPAAICRDGTLIVFLGETLFDYRTVLYAGDQEVLDAAWRELGKVAPQQLWVMGIPEGWIGPWQQWQPEAFSVAPRVLRSEITAGDFASVHTRSARLLRRLERAGARLHRYTGSNRELIEWVLRRKASQLWGEPNNLFADSRRIEFLAAAFALDPTAVDIFTLEHEGNVVSALITLRDGSVRRFYNTYHDEAWGKHSPGVALLFEASRLTLEEGLDCDYMTGSQAHKTRLATSSARLYRVDASPAQVVERTQHRQLLAA